MKKARPLQEESRSAADILAANVARLAQVYRDPGEAPSRKAQTGRRLSLPALARIQRKPSHETVETLELLVDVFKVHVPGLEAWMLLYPELDPQRLPICVAEHERDLLRRIRTFAPKQVLAASKAQPALKRSAQSEPPAVQSGQTPPDKSSLRPE
jgi:hypothetical protein